METRLLIALFVLLLYPLSHAQQESGKINSLEFKVRASFKEVTHRYEIQEDTVFFSAIGFLVNPEMDTVVIDSKEYVIMTYPPYTGGKQKSTTTDLVVQALRSDDQPIHFPIKGLNGKTLCMLKEDFDKLSKQPVFSLNLKYARVSTGQLTLPFKLRPKQGDKKFQMTTDVTLGAYAGLTFRIAKRKPAFITVPVLLGLSFINVNENTTSTSSSGGVSTGVYPGFTWSTGIVLQYNKFNAGLVLGKDYASGIAEDWIYHKKTWYSFAIGYSFLKEQ